MISASHFESAPLEKELPHRAGRREASADPVKSGQSTRSPFPVVVQVLEDVAATLWHRELIAAHFLTPQRECVHRGMLLTNKAWIIPETMLRDMAYIQIDAELGKNYTWCLKDTLLRCLPLLDQIEWL